MRIKNILLKVLNKRYRTLYLIAHGFYDNLSDIDFLKKSYLANMKKNLDIINPKTFNEKLQWLKLYDHRPEYTMMVDKYLVKEYVAGLIGEEHIIPTIGVWDDVNQINFERLPEQFVLKCNHNSGLGMYICNDKCKMNIEKVMKQLKEGLKQDYYLTGREWPYKNVVRKIIAETYMSDESGQLIDYKVHCFNGEPRFILVCKDRFKESGLTEDFYTSDWTFMPMKRQNIPQSKERIEKPDALEEILNYARVLSKNIPFVRVDFYVINERVYFSELTFFPASGFKKFEPESWDDKLGSWLQLPE